MTLTVFDYLKLREMELDFPAKDFYEAERNSCLKYAVALATAGIKSDAALEESLLRQLVLDYAFRLAYINAAEFQSGKGITPPRYSEWLQNAKTVRQTGADE